MTKDCELKILVESENGFIGYCTFCNAYSIVFNCLNRLFTPEEYISFRQYLLNFKNSVEPNTEMNEDAKDLFKLQEMLIRAKLMEEILTILELKY